MLYVNFLKFLVIVFLRNAAANFLYSKVRWVTMLIDFSVLLSADDK